jgi:uncharacterized protein YbjQ (UPF0145 family)
MKHIYNVTTASTIEGWRIEEYRGVVSAHVVAGTGIISDTFAAFSDFFGGRSQSYRNQISSLYNEAITQIADNATRIGGNWVIGLKVDVDEISGKGMQMFMITAVGTAVNARCMQEKREKSGTDGLQISKEDLEVMMERQRIIKLVSENKLSFYEHIWSFVIENQIVEVAQRVLQESPSKQSENSQYTKNCIKEYFSRLPRDAACKELYDALGGDKADEALHLIINLNLTNYDLVNVGLFSNDFDVRKKVLQTLSGVQPFYTQTDLAVIDALISNIPKFFPKEVRVVTKSGIMGGSKQSWLCICGHINDLNKDRCSKCDRDQGGFKSLELTPDQAIDILNRQKDALTMLFDKQQ